MSGAGKGDGEGGHGEFASAGILEAILESASQSILAVEGSGEIVAANARVEEMFGYRPEELVGEQVERLVPDGVRERHSAERQAYFRAPKVRPMGEGLELRARRKDGREFPVEISLSYVEGENGPMAIAFISDITHRKTLEDQLLQSQKLEAVGRLAGGIAHDFNNLLTVIMGYDEMLLGQLSPLSPTRGYAEEILKAAERAAALTRQLLTFGRRQIVRPAVLDVSEALGRTEGMLRRLLGENITLKYCLAPGAGKVLMDQSQLDQVAMNLLINAREAMTGGGSITLETNAVELDETYARTHAGVKPGAYVQISVSDEGTGMDEETQRHIFEPFFSTKGDAGNSGLGLATVYGIVKQNGGDIWLYSQAGVGTTFKVYLPRVDEAADEEAAKKSDMGPMRGAEKVLVVEDEEGVRSLMCDVLRRSGYEVLAATSPQEALEMSRNAGGEIDLLITDVIMPGMNGRELARQMMAKRQGLSVLYVSGYTENMTLRHGVLDADVNFLQKPFPLERLLRRVRETLDNRR